MSPPTAERPLRIAYGRVAQETNALSPLPTTLEDFRRTHWWEGKTLHARTGRWGYEAPGFLRHAELSGVRRAIAATNGAVEAVPLLSAWAVPSGPLTAECFAALRGALLDRLRAAGPLDGVVLVLHGAMGVDGIANPDAVLLRAVREWLDARAAAQGRPRPLVAVVLDLHAALDHDITALADVLCAYRTNPHRDHAATGERATKLLIAARQGQVRPVHAWRSLPMVLGGGLTLDFLPPMRQVFARMKALERQPDVLDCSLFTCHVWNDHPELGWAVYVTTNNNPQLAEQLADELAELAWSMRRHGLPEGDTPASALAKVRAARWRRRLGTALLCDVSDVVGAGAPGDNPRLIEALLRDAPDLRSYAPMRAPKAVDALWQLPEGSRVDQDVGGEFDPALNPPLRVRGTLARKRTMTGVGRVVLLDLGHLQLALTEGPALVMRPIFYRSLGLEPLLADICVVKSFFPFRLFFLAENRLTLYVKTRGVTDFDWIDQLQLHDPVYPVAAVHDWRPGHAARRARAQPGQ